MSKVNGVITLSEWERAEQLEEAIFDFKETETAMILIKKYKETKNENYFIKYIEAEGCI